MAHKLSIVMICHLNTNSQVASIDSRWHVKADTPSQFSLWFRLLYTKLDLPFFFNCLNCNYYPWSCYIDAGTEDSNLVELAAI